MRITSLELKRVGPFEDTTINFPAGTNPDRADVYLLVGENGCGKTTALRALAASFDSSLSDDVTARLRGHDAYLAVGLEVGRIGMSLSGDSSPPGMSKYGQFSTSGPFYHCDQEGRAALIDLRNKHSTPSPGHPRSHVVLAYGIDRMVTSSGLKGIQPMGSNPLHGWSGSKNSHRSDLPRWLLNTRFRASAARDEGDAPAAALHERKLEEVQSALSKLIDEPVRIRTDTRELVPLLEFDGRQVPIDLLPDGLRALLSWVGDIHMRLDRIPWIDDLSISEREFTLILDEVGVHLHPRWQRRVLHVCQDLFPRAQIFASTHSPHIINSVSDAHVHVLERRDGGIVAHPPLSAQTGRATSAVLAEILGVPEEFNPEIQVQLVELGELIRRRLGGEGVDTELATLAASLHSRGGEAAEMTEFRLRKMEDALKAAQ